MAALSIQNAFTGTKIEKFSGKAMEELASLYDETVMNEYFGNCGNVQRLKLTQDEAGFKAASNAFTGYYTEQFGLNVGIVNRPVEHLVGDFEEYNDYQSESARGMLKKLQAAF